MSEIVLNLITCIMKGIFICESLNYCLNLKKDDKKKVVTILLYILGFYLLETGDYKEHIYRHLYTCGIFYIYSREHYFKKKIQMPMTIGILCIYEIASTFNSIITVMVIAVLPFIIKNEKMGMVGISIMLRIAFLSLGFKLIKRLRVNSEEIIKRMYLIYTTYLLVICVKIPFLYTEIRDGLVLKIVFLFICFCTTIFFIISQIERHNNAKEKARIEESNKALTAKLHKSQEILPAMVQVLSDVTEKNGAEMEEHKAHKLLEEVSNLYSQQLKENEKDDLQLKNFCSTGLTLLDQQLNVYQNESIERECNLDIFVQAPINEIIKQNDIDQLRLQRAIGDLIRNAFCAVGKTHKKGGHILLIIGCKEKDVLEIAVMDDGVKLPLQVLEAFGKRGVTTGGTGNGLADIWEFAKDAKASIRVDELKEEDSFTKKISIIFDGLEKYSLNSSRRDDIKNFIWNN